MVAIAGAKLVLSAISLAVLVLFAILFMGIAANPEAFFGGEGGKNGNNPKCDIGQHWDQGQNKCVSDTTNCGPGQHWDSGQNRCVNDTTGCDPGHHWDSGQNKCVPDSTTCAAGQHWDASAGKCTDNRVRVTNASFTLRFPWATVVGTECRMCDVTAGSELMIAVTVRGNDAFQSHNITGFTIQEASFQVARTDPPLPVAVANNATVTVRVDISTPVSLEWDKPLEIATDGS